MRHFAVADAADIAIGVEDVHDGADVVATPLDLLDLHLDETIGGGRLLGQRTHRHHVHHPILHAAHLNGVDGGVGLFTLHFGVVDEVPPSEGPDEAFSATDITLIQDATGLAVSITTPAKLGTETSL